MSHGRLIAVLHVHDVEEVSSCSETTSFLSATIKLYKSMSRQNRSHAQRPLVSYNCYLCFTLKPL